MIERQILLLENTAGRTRIREDEHPAPVCRMREWLDLDRIFDP